MGAGYVFFIVIILVLLTFGLFLARHGKERTARQEQVAQAGDTLRYHVPEGQDPAAVLVALSQGGFEALADDGDSHSLTIVLPLGAQQREEVRILLENEAGQSLDPQDHTVPDVPVRFDDER